MQSTTQEKQRFLRQQILQGNYNPDEFITFLCKDLHIQELDAQLIEMKVLEEVVMKFKQYKYYQEEPKQQKKLVKIEYEKGVFDYEFNQTWKCLHAEHLMEQVQIFIPKFEVKQTEGLFFSIGSKTEVWYIIQSNISKQTVKRLQEDVEWLSETISKMYPLFSIPQLIPAAKDSENNYPKRRKELEEYLQIVAKRPQLKISNLFYDFLTLPYEKIEKLKKNWNSMSFGKGTQSIKNDQGYIKVSFTNKLRNFVQNTLPFNRSAQSIHESLSLSIDKVSNYLTSASNQLNKIVQMFAQLHEAYSQLINKHPQQKINQYNEVLININNLFHQLSENLNSTSKIFTASLKEFHKIELNYDNSITKLYRTTFQAEKEYIYFKSNLNRKKERVYPDVSRWQVEQKMTENRRLTKQEAFSIMLPRESQQEEEMRNWMAFLYSNYRSQFQRFIGFQVNRYVTTFCTLCSDLLLSNRTYVEEVTKFIEESKRIQVK